MQVTLLSKVDNETNFSVTPASVVIGPYASATALLEYTPSSMDTDECAAVSFHNESLGVCECECGRKRVRVFVCSVSVTQCLC